MERSGPATREEADRLNGVTVSADDASADITTTTDTPTLTAEETIAATTLPRRRRARRSRTNGLT